MIEVSGLTKYYGSKKALDNISFSVQSGEILGFLGPNGAGKSTTMNIITGYLSSTSGTVTIDGHEILAEPQEAKAKLGYLPEHPPLYLDMTVKEYLSFMYDLKKLRLKKWLHIEEICGLVKITDVYGRIIKNLSKGYRQRVGLAQALLGGPEVLILDEPTVGLDPKQIAEIRQVIQDLGKQHTIILSSHILSEIQATCDRVIVIAGGRLLADDTSENLAKKMSNQRILNLRVDGPQEEVGKFLAAQAGVERVEQQGSKEPGAFDYLLEMAEGADIRRELFRGLANQGWPLLAMGRRELSLEEIFLQLTAQTAQDETDPKAGKPAGEADSKSPEEAGPEPDGDEDTTSPQNEKEGGDA